MIVIVNLIAVGIIFAVRLVFVSVNININVAYSSNIAIFVIIIVILIWGTLCLKDCCRENGPKKDHLNKKGLHYVLVSKISTSYCNIIFLCLSHI